MQEGSVKSYEPEVKTTYQGYTQDYAAPLTQYPDVLLSDLAVGVVVLCAGLDYVIA